MKTFNLPDLGEGLPDAEINEWHIKVGDEVEVDQPLASMETAKAVVDVPSPFKGKIAKLFGQPGDIIKTGAPLISFDLGEDQESTDSGTVVGNIEASSNTLNEASTISSSERSNIKVTPAVRAIAKKLNVDLKQVSPSNPNGVISKADVENAAKLLTDAGDLELIRGVRRTMVSTMSAAHAEVVPVTIFDDADINAWADGTDITARLIQAICHACKQEPALNAWYDSKAIGRRLHKNVNLGLAMDTKEGLFVPVIKNAETLSPQQLREQINNYKASVQSREIPPEDLRGASITLSNFGNFAGRYASPIVVPPQVAILGVGKLREQVVAESGAPAIHRMIPLSLSFDHRAVSGGEATRFLGAVIESLSQA